ncbi:MAG: hypothetical protein P9L99_08430 [Candidatus Lernaella stagnicola]|nr:hypothetical protein [Candidatus Lernaella stagnicola]
MRTKHILVLVVLAMVGLMIGSSAAFAAEEITMAGYVFHDKNWNGEFDAEESGIGGVRVMFTRDYDCNGIIDGNDEIYDYDYTLEGTDGNDGFFFLPTHAGRCYVADLDPGFIPTGLVHTTDELVAVATTEEDYLDINFGLAAPQPVYYEMGGYVLFDDNGDGVVDTDDDAGIEGVRVDFYRDYQCDGFVDGADELFDFDFSDDTGFFRVVNAKHCYVAVIDLTTAPVDMMLTTADSLGIIIAGGDEFGLTFGLTHLGCEPGSVNPKRTHFWRRYFDKKKGRHGHGHGHGGGHFSPYDKKDVKEIARLAATYSPYFDDEKDIKKALKAKFKQNYKRRDWKKRALKHYAGLLMNLAAYELSDQLDYQAGFALDTPVHLSDWTDAATVAEAIADIEDYLDEGTRDSYRYARKIARLINAGAGIDPSCF